MNQGPRYVRLMEKSRGQKSRATVPLNWLILTWYLSNSFLWNIFLTVKYKIGWNPERSANQTRKMDHYTSRKRWCLSLSSGVKDFTSSTFAAVFSLNVLKHEEYSTVTSYSSVADPDQHGSISFLRICIRSIDLYPDPTSESRVTKNSCEN